MATVTELNRGFDFDGKDVTNVGAFDADSVSTDVSRTKSSPVYDVTHPDFGAVGDGNTDDTTAIQDAANAAAPNGDLYFPDTGDDFVVSAAIDLGGASIAPSPGSVRAATGGSWDAGIAPDGDTGVFFAHNQDNWTVRGLTVDVNGEDAAGIVNFGGSWVGLNFNTVRNSIDCGVQHWGGAGENTNDCFFAQTIGNRTENNKWNLVFDGGHFSPLMAGNTSVDARTRHISIDNRTYTDSDIRGVNIYGNVMRHTGSGEPTEEAIFLRGGAAGDVQRSTDGRVFGRCSNNALYGWQGDCATLVRCGGRFDNNYFHGDVANSETPTAGIVIDEQYALRVTDNDFLSVSSGPIIDHSAAVSGNNLYVLDNIDNTADISFFNGGTDAAWVFDRNYSDATEVSP